MFTVPNAGPVSHVFEGCCGGGWCESFFHAPINTSVVHISVCNMYSVGTSVSRFVLECVNKAMVLTQICRFLGQEWQKCC